MPTDYTDILDGFSQQKQSDKVRATATLAVDTNPDEEAGNRRIAAYLGTPVDAVRALPVDAKRAAALKEIEGNAATSPVLQKKYTDKDFAALAHDDSGVLSSIAAAAKGLLGTHAPNVGGAGPAGSMNGSDFARRVADIKSSNQVLDGYEATKMASLGVVVDKGAVDRPRPSATDPAEHLARSLYSGVLSLNSVAGKLAGELFVLSEADAAARFKDDPKGLQNYLDNHPGAAPYRFARSQQQASQAVMEDESQSAKDRYGSLTYSATEAKKSAFSSPVKVLGDALTSLPSSLALGVSVYLSKGAARSATADALAAGLSPQAAKAAGVLAAEQAMVKIGVGSEGLVGYAQQANQTREEADKVTDAQLAESEPYQKLIAQGYDPKVARVLVSANAAEQAGIIAGIVDASVNAVGGKILGRIIGEGGRPLAAGAKGALTEAVTEGVQSPGEQLGQNLAVQKNLNPAQDLSEGLLESALQGFAVGGLTGGAFSALAAKSSRQDQFAQQAERHVQVLENMQAAMQASKLLERSPDTLRSYAQDLADEGVPNVYVDGAKLVEAGIDLQALARAVPSVAAQLDQVHTGGDIVIPTGELLTNSIGTAFSQSLIDHARTDVNGMSRAEAKEYMATKGDALNSEIERVLAEKESDTEFKAGRDQVQAEILTQLNDIKRFTPSVNQQYATLASNFYAVMAARTGMSVRQFADTYKLGFKSTETQGGMYDQGGKLVTESQAFKDWFGDSKVVDAEGKPMVVYHGTSKPFTRVNMKKGAQGAFWFGSDKAAIEQGESGAEGTAHIMDLHASIKNPAGWEEYDKYGIDELQQLGYDGVILPNPDGSFDGFVFEPGQVKSTKNRGTYNPNDANILNQGKTPQQVGAEFFDRVKSDPAVVDEYIAKNGKVVDPDRAKEMVPEYVADPSIARFVHEGSSLLAQKVYDKLITQNPQGDAVTFTAGGGGSGKTESFAMAKSATGVETDGIIMDGTLSKIDKAISRIEQALSAGAPVDIVYTNRRVDDAMRFAMMRKRVVPVSVLVDAHIGASNTIRALAEKYKDNPNVSIGIVNNLGGKADIHVGVLDDVPVYDHNQVERELYAIATEARDSGAISADRYAALTATNDSGESANGNRQVQAGNQGEDLGGSGTGQRGSGPLLGGLFYQGSSLDRGKNGAVTKSNNVVGNQGGRSADDSTPGDPVQRVAQQILSAMQSNPTGEFALRVIPGEFTGAINVGDSLPVSKQWVDGTETHESLDGTSGVGIRDKSLPSVMRAIQQIGAHGKSGPNGYYYGKRIALVEGEHIRSGEDVGEVLVRDPKVIGFWSKPTNGNTAVQPNESTAPDSGGAYDQSARGQIAFGNDITQQASIISLLKKADLSSFIHESGHFFLEVQADLANRIAARIANGEQVSESERGILSDMNASLAWMGVKATPEMTALDHWAFMTADEKRQHHEQFARGFEAYAFEGRAPSMELQKTFQTFRAWLVNVYRAVLKSINANKADIAGAMRVELSDEVRGVMDRMLATSDQIAESEAARNMGPLFKTAEEAGMSLDEFKAYHDQGAQATMDAVQELQGKGLRDMQWLQNARSRKLKELQKQHNALRRMVASEVRAEVLSQPIYRAWTFLTSKQTDKVVGEKPVGKSQGLNPEVDNLFEAIAKLGGIDRAQAKSQWGVADSEELASGVFGAPVLRKTNGLSIDAMADRLLENGYLLPDEHGKAGLDRLEELFDDQSRGVDRYSISRDMAAAYGDAPANLPELPEVGYGKLRTEELRRRYGTKDDAVWRKLSDLRMTSDEGGLDPDVVGELFGFSSGDELVKTLAATEPPKSVIESMTDTRMLQEHGDLSTPAGLERAADAAIHNDARAKFVATELKALQKAMSVREKTPGQRHTVDVLANAAKDYATQVIARLKVRDVRPAQYAAAEARAAKAATKAVGDVAKAAEHKRNQLINLYATKAAYQAQEDVTKAVAYFKRFDAANKALDPEYQDQIDQLLESVELRQTSLKETDRRKSLAEWAQAQEDMGLPAEIPDSLLREANRKSIKDMTVEEVRGLRDTIKQIEHLGRLKHKLLKAKDRREFAVIVAEAAVSIRDNGGDAKPVSLETPTGVMPWLQGFAAGHRKMSSLLRQMDGGKDGGPMWNILGRTMNEAGTQEAVMNEQAVIALAELYAPMLKLKGGLNGDLRFIPEINNSLTRGGRLAVALNWGNETNRQRVKGGDGWVDEQVGAIFKTLTREEWAFVQNTWDYIDTFWPQIAAKQKRVTGLEPQKVEPSPFSMRLADGEIVNLRGGYYPIQYDANRDDKAEKHDAAAIAKDMLGGAFTRATTRKGHTKARVDTVNRPVKKTLDVITQHITQVTHDLAWHEWLIDANRLVDANQINGAIRTHYGTEVLRTMKDALAAIATADVVPQTKMDQALLHLRTNISRSTMGFSMTTAFMQPFGLTQSMVRIGSTHVLRGLARWGGDALRFENSLNWVQEKSDFMRLRSKTFNRELHEIKGRVSHGHSKARQIYDASLFLMMQKMQLVADVPTWIGGYEKALALGHDDATAVAMADQGVLDSQGGGQTKDMAELQRKHPLLAMFYSYFNVTYNLAAESTAKTDFKNPLALAGWFSDMALLMVIPALGPAIALALLRGEGGGDEEKWGKKLLEWQAGYMLGTVMGLRETSGLVAGFDYSGPPVGRIVGDLGKLGKQVAQGEADDGLSLAALRLLGSATGIPTVQIIRSWRGWQAWENGEAPPTSVLIGPPPKD